MSTLLLVLLMIAVTFAATWLALEWWGRRVQRLVTRMQNEAWRAWTDEWDGES